MPRPLWWGNLSMIYNSTKPGYDSHEGWVQLTMQQLHALPFSTAHFDFTTAQIGINCTLLYMLCSMAFHSELCWLSTFLMWRFLISDFFNTSFPIDISYFSHECRWWVVLLQVLYKLSVQLHFYDCLIYLTRDIFLPANFIVSQMSENC